MNKIHKRVYNLVNEFSIKMLYNTNLNNTEVSLQATGFVSILPLYKYGHKTYALNDDTRVAFKKLILDLPLYK